MLLLPRLGLAFVWQDSLREDGSCLGLQRLLEVTGQKLMVSVT